MSRRLTLALGILFAAFMIGCGMPEDGKSSSIYGEQSEINPGDTTPSSEIPSEPSSGEPGSEIPTNPGTPGTGTPGTGTPGTGTPGTGTPGTDNPGTEPCVEKSTSTALMAGQHIHVGTVTARREGNTLIVQITTDGWRMTESHLNVAASNEDLGSAPGRFRFKAQHNPGVTSFTYRVDLAKLGLADSKTLAVAFHAVVRKGVSGGGGQEETAWGKGNPLGGGWSMYFNYTSSCPSTDDGGDAPSDQQFR